MKYTRSNKEQKNTQNTQNHLNHKLHHPKNLPLPLSCHTDLPFLSPTSLPATAFTLPILPPDDQKTHKKIHKTDPLTSNSPSPPESLQLSNQIHLSSKTPFYPAQCLHYHSRMAAKNLHFLQYPSLRHYICVRNSKVTINCQKT